MRKRKTRGRRCAQPRPHSTAWPRRRLIALALFAVGALGCAATGPATAPSFRCPVPSESALSELEAGRVAPPIRNLLARYEILCEAMDASRGEAGRRSNFWGRFGRRPAH